MSTTSGSLISGYDNNNLKVIVKHSGISPSSRQTSPSLSVMDGEKGGSRKRKSCCPKIHLNNLWSLWYGIFGTILQVYTAIKCIKRIVGYSLLSWPEQLPIPVLELNTSLGLTGAAILLVPLFLAVAVFKIGNLANDGIKLGRQLSTCSRDRSSELVGTGVPVNGSCGLWKHGGPTAPFVHLVIAFCLLLPKLLMEARLIEAGFLPQESIWRTDLDFMVVHRDRLVVLSFMTSTNNTSNSAQFNQPRPSVLPVLLTTEISATINNQPTPLPLTANTVTNFVFKTFKDLVGHENHTQLHPQNVDTGWGSSVSVEYMNLASALLVYSVRYAAIFWATNKCMGLIFSFQLLINGLQTLLTYAGMSVLYKIQIIGVWKSLPLLKHQPISMSPFGGQTPFLLNPQVTLALYILSTLLVLASSLVLYLYGHTRFNSFLNQERERKIISLKESSNSKWSYFTHCAALCVLVSVGVCNAPLLHDYTVAYKGSLDDTILMCIIGEILHLFLWVVVWLFLTIKQKWIFKIRVTVGRATVRQARSIRLVTDVDLKNNRYEDPVVQPLLVVGNGRTYTVSDTSPKKAIMGIIQRTTMTKKKSENGSVTTNDDDCEEQIYWLRPALVTPQSSPDSSKQLCWFNKKPKHKVTFNESTSTSVNRCKGGAPRGKRIPRMDEDDGDYATLRELPLAPPSLAADPGEDTASEEGKLLACVHDEHVTYASNSQELVPPLDYEDPSPLLTPEPLSDREDTTNKAPITVIVHNHTQQQTVGGQTPRCLRRADSGMPHDELTPRSESVSTECSTSPPEAPGSNHSETSSGVHSNESSDHHSNTVQVQNARRATSVADLIQPVKEEIQWKSCSLQRNVQPPTSTTIVSSPQFAPGTSTQSVYGYIGTTYTAASDDTKPAVILENPAESTVVIRRKTSRPKTTDISQTPVIKEEPFGRATNMRMTSFTENSDLKSIQASSATLPHYPTQPAPVQSAYPHCSTMPLPQHTTNPPTNQLTNGNSCNVYVRQHTTIPTHHNGVRLFNGTQNPYIKRLQNQPNGSVRVNTNEPIYTGINRMSGEIYHYNS